MAVKTSTFVTARMLLAACTAEAAVLCTTRSGTVKLRPNGGGAGSVCKVSARAVVTPG